MARPTTAVTHTGALRRHSTGTDASRASATAHHARETSTGPTVAADVATATATSIPRDGSPRFQSDHTRSLSGIAIRFDSATAGLLTSISHPVSLPRSPRASAIGGNPKVTRAVDGELLPKHGWFKIAKSQPVSFWVIFGYGR